MALAIAQSKKEHEFYPVIVMNGKMELNVHIKSVKLNKIKNYPLPFIDSTSTVYSIVDAVQKVSSCNASS